MTKQLTLIIVHKHPHVLLGIKKRGFGSGKWNGFGGKLENGESIEDASRREMREESGVDVVDLQKAGVIQFEFQDNPEILEVHIFRSTDIVGDPVESEEMKPQWFPVDEIPFDAMWPDDKYWLPLLLEGKMFRGRFEFDEENKITHHELMCVDDSTI